MRSLDPAGTGTALDSTDSQPATAPPQQRVLGVLQAIEGWFASGPFIRGLLAVSVGEALITLVLLAGGQTLRKTPGAIYLYLLVVLWAAYHRGFLQGVFAVAFSLIAESLWVLPPAEEIRLGLWYDFRLALFGLIGIVIALLLARVGWKENTLRTDYEQQRDVAILIQQAMLPRTREIPGYDSALFYRPSSHEARVGGDFVDVFAIGGGNFGVLLGDVIGHGVAASVLTAELRYGIRALACQGLSPSVCLAAVNDILCRTSAPGRMATAFFGIVNPREHQLCFASAGHEPALLWQKSGQIEELGLTGVMLGVALSDRCVYEEENRTIEPGGGLVLYTDGIVEARRDREMYGFERLERLVVENRTAPAAAALDLLQESVQQFAGGAVNDDMAALWIRRLED